MSNFLVAIPKNPEIQSGPHHPGPTTALRFILQLHLVPGLPMASGINYGFQRSAQCGPSHMSSVTTSCLHPLCMLTGDPLAELSSASQILLLLQAVLFTRGAGLFTPVPHTLSFSPNMSTISPFSVSTSYVGASSPQPLKRTTHLPTLSYLPFFAILMNAKFLYNSYKYCSFFFFSLVSLLLFR